MVWTYGYFSLDSSHVSGSTLNVGVVQANIDQAHKWDTAYRFETLDRYERLTKTVIENSDVVIWPEAATPFVFEEETGYQSLVRAMIKEGQLPLVFGSPALRRRADGKSFLLNSAYVLTPEGELSGRYDKQHLVPFGEYIPLRKILFFLDKLVVGIGDFQAGPGPDPSFHSPWLRPNQVWCGNLL